MSTEELTCAACNKPIRPHDFYVKALRGDEDNDPDYVAIAGTHTVHVPNCPSPSLEDAFAMAGVDYEAYLHNKFKRVAPHDPLATTDHRA